MKNFLPTISIAIAVFGATVANARENAQSPEQQSRQPLTMEQMQARIDTLQSQMTMLQQQQQGLQQAQQQQQEETRKIDLGSISGSVESNNIWYVPDRVAPPAERFGSNNYVKIDYSRGNFTAGLQYELYAPVLQGYNPNLQHSKIANKFVGWSDGRFAVTVGDFYEQFGNGIILRSWEDRALGFNNSLEGVRAGFSNDWIAVKGVLARPRMFMDYADTRVRGADLSLSLSSLFKMEKHYLAVEGSYVNRYMGDYVGDTSLAAGVTPSMSLYSARLVYDAQFGFSFKAEHVGKGRDSYVVDGTPAAGTGSAQLIEMGYNRDGLGIFVTARRLKRMGLKMDAQDGSEANTLNYLPTLSRQYTYSLATLEPYSTDVDDEIGGQLDVFYTVPRGSKAGGKYGWKVHANFSTFYPLEKRGRSKQINMLYRDLSFDFEKQWHKSFKTTLMYAVQTFSPSKGLSRTTAVNNVFVLDMLAKFTRKVSMRFELQYLYSKENSDWWAGLVELNVAPYFSFFVGDMYNYAKEKVHYYSAGAAVTFSRTRVALSYGRNRAGYVCSGGVCRFMPAYTGANIAITTSF